MTLVLVGIPVLFWGEKTFKNRGQKGARQVYMHTYLEFCSDCRIRVDSKNPGRSSWGDFLHGDLSRFFYNLWGVSSVPVLFTQKTTGWANKNLFSDSDPFSVRTKKSG